MKKLLFHVWIFCAFGGGISAVVGLMLLGGVGRGSTHNSFEPIGLEQLLTGPGLWLLIAVFFIAGAASVIAWIFIGVEEDFRKKYPQKYEP